MGNPLSRYGDPLWIFPSEWFAGEPVAIGHRSINFNVPSLPDGLTLTSGDHCKLLASIKRALYSFWRHPNKHPIDPSTLRTYCNHIRAMARWIIAHRYQVGVRGFADLNLDDIVEMMGRRAITNGKKEKHSASHMESYYAKSDIPRSPGISRRLLYGYSGF